MASSLMHLAIAKRLISDGIVQDNLRFQLGVILPDAMRPDQVNHADSHYKATVCDGTKKMIDFTRFRSEFQAEVDRDDLYLGYYTHLVQDAIFRKFLYSDHGYCVTCREDVEVLHRDYHLLNTYVVSEYHLENEIKVPEAFEDKRISHKFPFRLESHLEQIKSDFIPEKGGKIQFVTEAMVDEYIETCYQICKQELEQVRAGHTGINPMDYAWELPLRPGGKNK